MVIVAVALLAARMALPTILRHKINARLQQTPDYSGQVADIDVHLWRGAYQLEGVEIVKQNGAVAYPLLKAKQIDFSLAWLELFRGRILSEIYITGGELTLVKAASAERTQTPLDRRWQDVVGDIFPIDIAYLQIDDGLLRYVDERDALPINLTLKDLQMRASGLRNRPSDPAADGKALPAEVALTCVVDGGGSLRLEIAADPLAEQLAFDLNLTLEKLALPQINDVLRAYANVDVSAGTLDVFSELEARDGRIEGYVKPFLENLDFSDYPTQHKPLPKRIWEGLVAGLATLFKNHARDQMGTRVPISGELGKVDAGTLAAIGNIIRHAFFQAFDPGVDHTVGDEALDKALEEPDVESMNERASDGATRPPVPPR